jgi:O-antigen biosynthesis protein WbqP
VYVNIVKRLCDFSLSLFGLVLLSPLFLFIMLLIKLDSRGPVFFSQKRVGMNKKYFQIYKFRTMHMNAPHNIPTHLLEDPDFFITRLGRFLRKTSLDELPQIWNILKGDMAFIGPRPALWNQDDLVRERDKYTGVLGLTANNLRPGLTGWAQINGRDELKIPQKARLDGEYVRRIGFLFDLRCFIGTIGSIIGGRGVVEGGTGTKGVKEIMK